MKKTSGINVSGSVENSKNTLGRKQSFWNFLCPCLRSKKSDKQKKEQQRESYKRQEFYEEKTQIEDNIHEETESNLGIKQVSEFMIIKREEIRVQNLEQDKQQIRQIRKQETKAIKFNVKRANNMGGYLKEVKAVVPQQEYGKQNSRPNTITKQRYPAQKDNDRMSFDQRITQAKRQNRPSNPEGIFKKVNNNRIGVNRQQLISIEKHLQQMDGLGDYEFLQNWQDSYENHYPINNLQQNKLLLLGDKANKMLAKVTTVKLYPSSSAVERYKDSIRNKKLSQRYGNKDAQFNSPLDRFWDKRYFLFERFDQGIKLDEESWYSVTPEAVADYISSKVNVKETILDAFCGAGGDCIKLAMSCKNIIANDIDPIKLNCLLNNAKIYDVNNITISASDFFNLDCKVSAVYIAPPWGGPDYYKIQSFHPEQFQPKLSLIIQKALTLSSNLFFLLPANTNVEALAMILCQKVRNANNFVSESCSLKLEKIYFNERLKFVAVFYGKSEIQSQIKLSDQLGFIYDLLRQSDDGVFKHKKLIRKVRQEYGMMNLLNFLFECEMDGNSQQNQGLTWMGEQLPMIVKFERFLINRKLIDQKTLDKIKQEQQMEYEYELRNKQSKNKKQKNKRIQKHKQKQQRHLPYNTEQNNTKSIDLPKEQCLEQEILQSGLKIPTLQIINRANQSKIRQTIHRNELTDTINSKISSDFGLEESHDVQGRDSMRTVSLTSQFQQDQLHNITYDRFTTHSDISIKDSIYPFQQYDHLSISIDESATNSRDLGDMLKFSVQSKHEEQLPETRSQRYSCPNVFQPRENFKMKKVKVGPKWQNGIVEDVNEDREKDY